MYPGFVILHVLCCLFIDNRVGNVPMEWYADSDHIGYTIDGKRVAHSHSITDQIDQFLSRVDDPNASYIFIFLAILRKCIFGSVGLTENRL